MEQQYSAMVNEFAQTLDQRYPGSQGRMGPGFKKYANNLYDSATAKLDAAVNNRPSASLIKSWSPGVGGMWRTFKQRVDMNIVNSPNLHV